LLTQLNSWNLRLRIENGLREHHVEIVDLEIELLDDSVVELKRKVDLIEVSKDWRD